MIFKKRALQLMQQRQNSNDGELMQHLIDGFSKEDESSEFKPFEIPALFPLEHVQRILSEIDKRLYVSSSNGKKLLISM